MNAALWLAVMLISGAEPDPDLVARFPLSLAEVARPLPRALQPDLESQPSLHDRLAAMAELAGRLDDRHQYSQSASWRAIMGWPEHSMGLFPSSDPLDEGLERYPVPAGRADPATDFRASLALSWLDPRRFSCQFPLRARFLARAALTPPGPLPLERGACRAFGNWVDSQSVDIDVIYVAQRWQDASATMGHVIFRLRKRDTDHVVGASSEIAFAYVAKDPADTPGYMWKGLTGELTAGVEIERFGDVWARYGAREGRDLHVYRLNLSDEERLFFLAEVFAQSRHQMRVPYAFLTVNCATMAWDTLRSVLPELPEHDGLLVHPHEVISMLLSARRVTPRGTIAARKTLARDAEAERETLGSQLTQQVAIEAHEQRWRSPAARADALKVLSAALESAGPQDPIRTDAVLISWADLTLDIEAFALDQETGGYRPGATGPALEAALELRALLPARDGHESLASHEPLLLAQTPAGGVRRSGSRQSSLAARVFVDDQAARPGLSWQTSVLDEQVGEARLVSLNPGARMRLLVNELVVVLNGESLEIERDRLVLVDSLTLGDTMRTDNGWFFSRLGFGFGAELMTRPRAGLPFFVQVHGGPALTLGHSRDFAEHLALTLELDLTGAARTGGEGLLRVAAAFGLEASVGLGLSRIRVRGQVRPGLALEGPVLTFGASVFFEIPLTMNGLTLVGSAVWARGGPATVPLETSLGLSF